VLLLSKTHFWAVVASSLVATAAGVVLSFGGMAAWQRARRPRRDSLHGEATSLPLETRVLAVCDVDDSERVYREARSQERALGLLRAESPTGFDARCVARWSVCSLRRVSATDRRRRLDLTYVGPRTTATVPDWSSRSSPFTVTSTFPEAPIDIHTRAPRSVTDSP
jgi:hypothetical protein